MCYIIPLFAKVKVMLRGHTLYDLQSGIDYRALSPPDDSVVRSLYRARSPHKVSWQLFLSLMGKYQGNILHMLFSSRTSLPLQHHPLLSEMCLSTGTTVPPKPLNRAWGAWGGARHPRADGTFGCHPPAPTRMLSHVGGQPFCTPWSAFMPSL